jgi:hypothetical protein
MKRIKTILSLSLAMLFISAISFTSCGGKKDTKTENATEQSEGGEHPTDSEHPTSGETNEHPTEGDSTEHPSSGEEHPTDN